MFDSAYCRRVFKVFSSRGAPPARKPADRSTVGHEDEARATPAAADPARPRRRENGNQHPPPWRRYGKDEHELGRDRHVKRLEMELQKW